MTITLVLPTNCKHRVSFIHKCKIMDCACHIKALCMPPPQYTSHHLPQIQVFCVPTLFHMTLLINRTLILFLRTIISPLKISKREISNRDGCIRLLKKKTQLFMFINIYQVYHCTNPQCSYFNSYALLSLFFLMITISLINYRDMFPKDECISHKGSHINDFWLSLFNKTACHV